MCRKFIHKVSFNRKINNNYILYIYFINKINILYFRNGIAINLLYSELSPEDKINFPKSMRKLPIFNYRGFNSDMTAKILSEKDEIEMTNVVLRVSNLIASDSVFRSEISNLKDHINRTHASDYFLPSSFNNHRDQLFVQLKKKIEEERKYNNEFLSLLHSLNDLIRTTQHMKEIGKRTTLNWIKSMEKRSSMRLRTETPVITYSDSFKTTWPNAMKIQSFLQFIQILNGRNMKINNLNMFQCNPLGS